LLARVSVSDRTVAIGREDHVAAKLRLFGFHPGVDARSKASEE